MRADRGAGRQPRAADPAARPAAAERASRRSPDPVLEVLTRRYYRSRDLENVQARRCSTAGRACPATTSCAAPAAPDRLDGPATTTWPAALAEVVRRSTRRPPSRNAVCSTSTCPGRSGPPTPTTWSAALHAHARPARRRCRRCRRVTVTVCTPEGRDVEQFTFRPSPGRAGRGPGHPRHAPADRRSGWTCGG